MKKLMALAAVAFVSLMAALGFAPAAQAYPDVQISLTAKPTTLYGGESFTATAKADVDCDWTLRWDGRTRTSSNSANDAFVTKFRADEVTKVTKIPLRGTCEYTSPSNRATATWERTIMITVLPRGAAAPPTADLPNTGGPNRLFIAGGVILLAAGASAVIVARRRAEEAEITVSGS